MPFGIFTERDLLNRILPRHVGLEERLGEHCTRPVVTARLKIGAKTAGRIMTNNKIKRLLLVSKGHVAGIVTARDLVNAFQRKLK